MPNKTIKVCVRTRPTATFAAEQIVIDGDKNSIVITLWHTEESYYSLLKMQHPTHVSAFEDARKARRAADEALVRLAVSGHPDASRADAASALDRLLSQLDRFSSLIE